jgi:large subunit ribosomal protein L11
MSLLRVVRLLVPAGQAKPGPAIGQALGPLGINMMEFCKAFNAATDKMTPSTPTPIRLFAMSNRTFTFVVKTPPTSWFIKKCAGVEKGSARPGHLPVGFITLKQVYEIAKVKKENDEHLKNLTLIGLCRSVVAQAKGMGVDVVNDVTGAGRTEASADGGAWVDPEEKAEKAAAAEKEAAKPAAAAAKPAAAKEEKVKLEGKDKGAPKKEAPMKKKADKK